MQITFREFIELAEGKKKEIKKREIERLKGAYYQGRQQASQKIEDLGPVGEPKSPERGESIKNMKIVSGRSAIIRAANKVDKRATKVAKGILKQQKEGFSYGSKAYQQELEKKKVEKVKEKRTQTKQTADQLYHERTRGRGIRSVHKGQSGWMKDGKFTPD
jgi:hypothetical protein